jgi:hypothetical protein
LQLLQYYCSFQQFGISDRLRIRNRIRLYPEGLTAVEKNLNFQCRSFFLFFTSKLTTSIRVLGFRSFNMGNVERLGQARSAILDSSEC